MLRQDRRYRRWVLHNEVLIKLVERVCRKLSAALSKRLRWLRDPPAYCEAQTGLNTASLTISSSKDLHRFTVEIASTEEQERRGLMFRTSLARERGMLFLYDSPRHVAYWMKNTYIPLDMIFIRNDQTIARIETAEPRSDVPVRSGEPVTAVLEIRGGLASELGIRHGDRVDWSG